MPQTHFYIPEPYRMLESHIACAQAGLVLCKLLSEACGKRCFMEHCILCLFICWNYAARAFYKRMDKEGKQPRVVSRGG